MTWTSIKADWEAMTLRIRADRADGDPSAGTQRDAAESAVTPGPDKGAPDRSRAARVDDSHFAKRG